MTGTPRIVVLGSYVHVFTIQVPRAPLDGETVIATASRADPGGKGSNQAIQMARLGAKAELLAVVGDDAAGVAALDLWRQEGVDARLVRADPRLPTGLAFVTLDASGRNRIAVDVGANAGLSAADVGRPEAAIEGASLITAQFEIPPDTVAAAFRRARAAGVRTLLNPAPARPCPPELFPLVDVLVPNRLEAASLSGLPPKAGAEAAAKSLRERGVGSVVVTLDQEGALILDAAGARLLPGLKVPVEDTTGAGDAFVGALAVGLAEDRPVDVAVRWSNAAGACCVTRAGVVSALGARQDLADLSGSPLE